MELRPVIARLEGLSRRLLLRILLVGTPRLLIVAFGFAVLSYGLDRGLELPVAVRAVLLIGAVGALGLTLVRHLLRPLSRKPSVEELALIAEQADPSLNDQLISAIQLERDLAEGRAVESPELIRELVNDTARRMESHDLSRAVSLAPARKPLFGGVLSTVAVLLLIQAFPVESALWWQRQILLGDIGWPREHTLVVTIQDIERFEVEEREGRTIIFVPERTSLQVQVTEEKGNLPAEVELVSSLLDDEEASETRISMGRPGTQPYFQHIFPPMLRSIVFHAEGGDDDDGVPLFEVRVAKAPRITRFEASYDYPDYTGLEDRTLPDANISAPEGTRITTYFTANMPLLDFELAFEEKGTVTLTADAEGNYTHSFVVESNDFYTYRLKGDNEVLSPEVPRFVVTCERDQAPRVAAELPDSTALYVTPNAIIPLKGLARDDYGITEVGIRWGIDRGQLNAGGVTFGANDFPPSPDGDTRNKRFFHAMDVSRLVMPARAAQDEVPASPERPIGEGDRFHFRFIAQDNRSTPGQPEPHRTFGDFEYQVQVLSSEDLQRELAQRQVRLRTRVRDIAELVFQRIGETEALLTALGDGEGGDETRGELARIEQEQRRIGVELETSARQFLRVYDGYLWNRLDPESVLTDKLIAELSGAWRSGSTDDPFKIYGGALAKFEPLINESDLIGRLSVIARLFVAASSEQSPEAARRLARALLVTDRDEARDQVSEALVMQRQLRDDLLRLVERLEAWEDYIDVIQGFRDLLQSQEGVQRKIKEATEKK